MLVSQRQLRSCISKKNLSQVSAESPKDIPRMAFVFLCVRADIYSLGKDVDFTDFGCRVETILGVGFDRKTHSNVCWQYLIRVSV